MDSPSSTFSTPSGSSCPASPAVQRNPYARDPLRRAIACVTCAKAKTKCDKALPSCTRCITKGIKCDPRSTRRTSDTSYRSSIRKSSSLAKKYRASNSIIGLDRLYISHLNSSPEQDTEQLDSFPDFNPQAKPDEQAFDVSGFPSLQPLATYSSHMIDEFHSYSSSPEQGLGGFAPVDLTHVCYTSDITPRTPDFGIYEEPLLPPELCPQDIVSDPWQEENLLTCGLGFDSQVVALSPSHFLDEFGSNAMDSQRYAEWEDTTHLTHPFFPTGYTPQHYVEMPLLPSNVVAGDDNDALNTDEVYALHQPTPLDTTMANLITSAPFMQSPNCISGAPLWCDISVSDLLPSYTWRQ
ncbi:hypothetical protein ACN47E_008432 [Coniothyrium glycines]